jgi:hypothetical protein
VILSTAALHFTRYVSATAGRTVSRIDFGLGLRASRVHSLSHGFGYSWALSPEESDELWKAARLCTLGDSYEVELPADASDFTVFAGNAQQPGVWSMLSKLQAELGFELTVSTPNSVFCSRQLADYPFGIARIYETGSVGACLVLPRQNLAKLARRTSAMRLAAQA